MRRSPIFSSFLLFFLPLLLPTSNNTNMSSLVSAMFLLIFSLTTSITMNENYFFREASQCIINSYKFVLKFILYPCLYKHFGLFLGLLFSKEELLRTLRNNV